MLVDYVAHSELITAHDLSWGDVDAFFKVSPSSDGSVGKPRFDVPPELDDTLADLRRTEDWQIQNCGEVAEELTAGV